MRYRVHWSLALIVICCASFLSAYKVNVEAMGNTVIAGRITSQLPMSLCTQYQYNICRVCSQCGCGQWDEDTLSLDFGQTSNSTTYICKQSSYQGQGQGNFQVNTIVFGMCNSEKLSSYDPNSCNVWSVQSMAMGETLLRITRLFMDSESHPLAGKTITLK